MSTICSNILNASIRIDCDTPPSGGVQPLLWLIPLATYQAATITYDSTNKLIVRSIALPAGKVSYSFEVHKNAHKPKFTLKSSDYGFQYLHEIPTAIENWNNTIKSQIPALANTRYVAIVINNALGDARIEIYGAQEGLSLQDGAVRDTGANSGVLTGTLGNDADYPEPNVPLSYCVLDDDDNFDFQATLNAVKVLTGDHATITNPQSQSVASGGNATFTVSATNYSSINWYKGGTLLASHTPTLTLTAVTSADAGAYHAEAVGNDGDVVISTSATLTVT